MGERNLLHSELERRGKDHLEFGVGRVGSPQVGVVLGDQFEDCPCFGRNPALAHGAESHRRVQLTGGGLHAVSPRLAVHDRVVGGVDGRQPDGLGSEFEGGFDGRGH